MKLLVQISLKETFRKNLKERNIKGKDLETLQTSGVENTLWHSKPHYSLTFEKYDIKTGVDVFDSTEI